VRGESALQRCGSSDDQRMADVLGNEPTSEFVVQMSEAYENLIACLDDESLRTIADYKLEGYTNEEVAAQLNCAPRTVYRKLERIRRKWSANVS
jgi:DNA-directed RNA polymerase specialized sigma24 family protein